MGHLERTETSAVVVVGVARSALGELRVLLRTTFAVFHHRRGSGSGRRCRYCYCIQAGACATGEKASFSFLLLVCTPVDCIPEAVASAAASGGTGSVVCAAVAPVNIFGTDRDIGKIPTVFSRHQRVKSF